MKIFNNCIAIVFLFILLIEKAVFCNIGRKDKRIDDYIAIEFFHTIDAKSDIKILAMNNIKNIISRRNYIRIKLI